MVGAIFNHMVELGADASLVLDPRRPRNDEALRGTAEMGSDLLGPLERSIHSVSPTTG